MVTCIMTLVPRHVRVTSVALYNFFITNLSGLCTLLVPPIRASYDSPHIFSFFAEPLAGAAAAAAATAAAAAAAFAGGESGTGGGGGGSLPSLPLHGVLGDEAAMAGYDGGGWSGDEFGGGAAEVDPVEFRMSAPGSTGLRAAMMWIYPGLFLASSCEFRGFRFTAAFSHPVFHVVSYCVRRPGMANHGIAKVMGQQRYSSLKRMLFRHLPPRPPPLPLADHFLIRSPKKRCFFLTVVSTAAVVPESKRPVFSLAAIVALHQDKKEEEAAAADAAEVAAAAAAESDYEPLAESGGGGGDNEGDGGWLSPTRTRWEVRSAAAEATTARIPARSRGPKRVFGGGVRNLSGGTSSVVGEGAGSEALQAPLLRGAGEASDTGERRSSPTQP